MIQKMIHGAWLVLSAYKRIIISNYSITMKQWMGRKQTREKNTQMTCFGILGLAVPRSACKASTGETNTLILSECSLTVIHGKRKQWNLSPSKTRKRNAQQNMAR